jgi:isoamylase
MEISEGSAQPLGSTCGEEGVNFAVFSSVADSVELCLFDGGGAEERYVLPGRTGPIRHGHIAGVRPGQRYGFRVRGPWNPAEGLLCRPEQLLIDPYARAVDGGVIWDDSLFPCDPSNPHEPPNTVDSAPFMPKSVVMDMGAMDGDDTPAGERGGPPPEIERDTAPRRALADAVVYEVHVKGFTMRHPRIPPSLRGTYAGLAHPLSLEYLAGLGVTAVELLPVQQFIHRRRLIAGGLRNYWGYDPICFFAPHNEYASDARPGGAVREFREMVAALHRAGIEVILDVVFNHTGEGDQRGPVLGFKGFDNRAYYRLKAGDPFHYADYTGTHNTLNTDHPQVQRMIMDSLRYWMNEMGVDGFRFDLAPALVREGGAVNMESLFFEHVRRDPILGRARLIAEPWDVGEGGYQAGRFPVPWSEWNDKYRDDVRDFWNGREGASGRFMLRFAGSPDMYRGTGRSPEASVNYVTCHDGFTLHDLVSYEVKHNEANGESNHDGARDNHAWNCGAEGPSDNEGVKTLRSRQKRNFLATLFLSQGVPMLLGGDEIGRSQNGNNNAYCQDNEVSWFDWDNQDYELREFVSLLSRFRKRHRAFRRQEWPAPGAGGGRSRAIVWYDAAGSEIEDDTGASVRVLQVFIGDSTGLETFPANSGGPHREGTDGKWSPGTGAPDEAMDGEDDFLIMFNSSDEDTSFAFPQAHASRRWVTIIDTERGIVEDMSAAYYEPGVAAPAGGRIMVPSHSLVVLRGSR